jgi:hypothetical protein
MSVQTPFDAPAQANRVDRKSGDFTRPEVPETTRATLILLAGKKARELRPRGAPNHAHVGVAPRIAMKKGLKNAAPAALSPLGASVSQGDKSLACKSC